MAHESILSTSSLAISLFSVLFSYVRTKEAAKMTKLKQSEVAERTIDVIEATIGKIRESTDDEEIESCALSTVKEIKRSEVVLGRYYNIVYHLIQPMWDAVREKQNYIKYGIGKRIIPYRTCPPREKLTDFENHIRMATYDLRRKLKI